MRRAEGVGVRSDWDRDVRIGAGIGVGIGIGVGTGTYVTERVCHHTEQHPNMTPIYLGIKSA